LYKSESPFEFKGIESELEQQRMREAAEGTDSEEEEERPRKRVHIIKKNAKVVKRKWEGPHPIHLDDIVLLFTPTLLQRISSSWVDCSSSISYILS